MLENLYPNTLYHVWVAAKSRRGEGAGTPRLPVRTEQYGEYTGVQGSSGEYRGVQGGRGSGVVFSSWPGCCNFVFRREIFGERCKIFITFLALVLKYFQNVQYKYEKDQVTWGRLGESQEF